MSIDQTISDLGEAFQGFKAKYDERLDQQQREIEDAHTKLAAAQMQGIDSAPTADDGVIHSFKAMRTTAQFKAHYAQKASGGEKVALSDFVRGVAGMKTTEGAKAALSRGQDTAGGFAVPDVVMPEILSALAPASSLLQAGAGVVPMEFGAKSVGTAVINALPQAAWRAESGALAQSEPTFRAVTAVPQSLAFMFKISRELLADAANMEAALRIAIGQAFAKELDRVGLRGTGTAPEPRGLLSTTGVQVVNHGAANGAQLENYSPILRKRQLTTLLNCHPCERKLASTVLSNGRSMEPLIEREPTGRLQPGVLRVLSNGKRIYAEEFKAELVRLCRVPGTSVAGTALAHGINANLLRRWIALSGAPASALAPALLPVSVRPQSSAVKPLAPLAPTVHDMIEIDVHGARVRLHGRIDPQRLGVVLDVLARQP